MPVWQQLGVQAWVYRGFAVRGMSMSRAACGSLIGRAFPRKQATKARTWTKPTLGVPTGSAGSSRGVVQGQPQVRSPGFGDESERSGHGFGRHFMIPAPTFPWRHISRSLRDPSDHVGTSNIASAATAGHEKTEHCPNPGPERPCSTENRAAHASGRRWTTSTVDFLLGSP